MARFTLALLLVPAPVVAAQELVGDDAIEIELRASDAVLEGRGPSRTFEYAVTFDGTLYVWASSGDVDPILRVGDPGGDSSAEDDDSGGGTTAFLARDVASNQAARITVAAKAAAGGKLVLHVSEGRESETTRAAVERSREACGRAEAARSAGDPARFREILAEADDDLLAVQGGERSPALARAAWELGSLAYGAQEFLTAQRAWTRVREFRSRVLPSDHADLQTVKQGLAITMLQLGDLRGARELLESVLEVRTRTLPDEHPALQGTRLNLAGNLSLLGELHGARELEEKVLDVFTRTLPEDHPNLLKARSNLAATLSELGDFQRARELEERVLEIRARTQPDEAPDLLDARRNLAITLRQLGDFYAARELDERVLEVSSRILPDDHPSLQAARQGLANTLVLLGDLSGARELHEKILAVLSRSLPDDHPELQSARANLAETLRRLGELDPARELDEKVLAVRSRTLTVDHHDLQYAMENLACTLAEQNELPRARELQEQVVAARAKTLPDDHPELRIARKGLGAILYLLGDLEGARELYENVLAIEARTLPADHLDLQKTMRNLLWTYVCLRRERDARAMGARLATNLEDEIVGSLGKLSPRGLEERLARTDYALSSLIELAAGAGVFEPDPALERRSFALCESRRSVAILAAALSSATLADSELGRLSEAEREQAERLAHIAQRGASGDEIESARRELDLCRRQRMERVASLPSARDLLAVPNAENLAARLAPDQAIVAYSVFDHVELDTREPQNGHVRRTLLAFVLKPDGALSRHDLGSLAPIERAVRRWRAALGAPNERGDLPLRGTPVAGAGGVGRAAAESGSELSRALVTPLLAALGDTKRVVLALDDVLHWLPFDALPLENGIVGERFALEQRLTLRELLWNRPAPPSDGRLVALGGASFDLPPLAPGEEEPETANAPSAAAAPVERPRLLRGTAWERGFEPLPETATEARRIAATFGSSVSQGRSPILLESRRASKDGVRELAPETRFLHLATHGWFAPVWTDGRDVRATLDEQLGFGVSMSSEEHVRSTSPMLMCGLAFAGANLEDATRGRAGGLVTAEEIASWDLSKCELAVLSACDTNVGERRAGQGVASLQKALHMAGARSVITSLWKVPDEATKDLMVDFYRRLWVEKKPKWQALWEAKLQLRNAKDASGNPKYTTRDWAAWVLTGDPN